MTSIDKIGNVRHVDASERTVSAQKTEKKEDFEFDKTRDTDEREFKFDSEKKLKEKGKTKHWFRAKNGPDKGSKFYSSSDYDFFGNYKGNKN